MAIVVKRRGKKEVFDERKTYASIYSACTECDLSVAESEKIAASAVNEVKKALKGRTHVNSTEIFGVVVSALAKEHEAVAFMYQTHREVF